MRVLGPVSEKKVMKWIFYFMKSLWQNLESTKFILNIRTKKKIIRFKKVRDRKAFKIKCQS